MRVIFPYAGNPVAEVMAAAHNYAPDAEYHDVGGDRTAYWELLRQVWADGEAFTVIEHDIEIREDVLPSLETCKRPWCGFSYQLDTCVMAALGCTRFSAALVRAHPHVLEQAGELSDSVLGVKDWHRLDTSIAQILMQRCSRRYKQHVHTPPVAHHKDYRS